MSARLLAFVIWGAVAASVVAWALRLGVQAPAMPSYSVPVDPTPVVRADWSRLLGAPEAAEAEDEEQGAPEPSLASRFRLLGVVAPKAPARPEGLALIAIDERPAKAFRVGAVVDGDMVLQSVHRGGASLGPRGGAAAVKLELPALPPPARGTLPVPVPGAAGAPPLPAPMGAVAPGSPGAVPPTAPIAPGAQAFRALQLPGRPPPVPAMPAQGAEAAAAGTTGSPREE